MKKFKLFLFIFTLLFSLCGCSYRDPVLASLPDYKNEFFYTDGGFQDYTDYAKYTYESVTAEEFEDSKYFTATTAEDVEEILLHIDNFEEWVEISEADLKGNYDFDKTIVAEGDYFYIKTKAGEFDNYSIYYFDIDAQILYYFHTNI